MQPSDSFRARRPPSPHRQGLTNSYPQAQPRFPQPRPADYLGADEKVDAVRQDAAGRPVLTRKLHAGGLRRMTSGEWKLLLVIAVVAVFVRLFRISSPNSVVFDEVHFGKFAGKYLRTRYYVDVHPPLAKLLITLASFIGGWDAVFDFKEIGKVYDNVPYVIMRLFPGILGIALVPITYLTLRALECSTSTAILGSVFVTFENALVTQSRLILLDSFLLFFTGLSVFFWVSFCNENKRKPFTEVWWTWLILTGLALGAVSSSKWVGFFTVATVGVSTIKQLWELIGDLSVPPRLFIRHFVARALCLILLPILFYMAMFEIHFAILQSSGDGDGFMSADFQHTLSGRGMQDTFADIALGSRVTLRHVNTQGGYLHSHPHNYPTGSKQQQITLYPHRDTNNDWIIKNGTADAAHADWQTTVAYVTNKMNIRLEHAQTEKRLHSHDLRPPVSEVDFQNEVSGYGFPGFSGDANDNFIVEIHQGESSDRDSEKRLKTISSKFRLRHQMTGCYLFSHKVKLPDWGFEQQEVTCNKNAPVPNSLWYIETNTNPLLGANSPKVNYKPPGFLSKFWELQVVMWRTNSGLTERHAYDSRPHQWPILRRGINFWVRDHRQIYLIGNPFVWWISTASVLLYIGVRGLLVIRAQRGYKDFHHTAVNKYDQLIGFLVLGWGLHYGPFFLMQRQLFLHHYFPALWFSILVACAVFDLVTSTLSPRRRIQIAAFLMVVAVWNFAHFSPLAYGNPWTKAQCKSAKWLKTWDFSCNDFFSDIHDYKTYVPTSTVAATGTTDKAQAKPPKKAEHTTEVIMEVVQPGRDIFANPVEDHEIKIQTQDPAAVEAKKKAQEEQAAQQKLKGEHGPPSPSDLAALEAAEREKAKEAAEGNVEEAFEGAGEKKVEGGADEAATAAAKGEGVEEALTGNEAKAEGSDGEAQKAQKEQKPLSPEEQEAERVRQSLFGKD